MRLKASSFIYLAKLMMSKFSNYYPHRQKIVKEIRKRAALLGLPALWGVEIFYLRRSFTLSAPFWAASAAASLAC